MICFMDIDRRTGER